MRLKRILVLFWLCMGVTHAGDDFANSENFHPNLLIDVNEPLYQMTFPQDKKTMSIRDGGRRGTPTSKSPCRHNRNSRCDASIFP